jgi:hypothetical protein
MPEQTPPPNDQQAAAPTEAQIRAELRAKALVEERAALEKLTKAELVERTQQARSEVEELRDVLAARDRVGAEVDRHFAEPMPPRRARPEDAFVVSALLDLHRTAGAERQGPTLRGRQPVASPRYLEAAKALGDELVDAILGPVQPKA